MYTVLHTFYDLKDCEHLYNAGESYPRDGYTPTDERVEELLTERNRMGKPMIQAVSEKGGEIPAQQKKPVRKATKSRKTQE